MNLRLKLETYRKIHVYLNYAQSALAKNFELCFREDLQSVPPPKKKAHPILLQCKLSYRNETGTNHHGLVSTSV